MGMNGKVPNEPNGSLDEDEVNRVLSAVVAIGPAEDDELSRVLNWAQTTRAHARLLELVLEGHAGVRWPEGGNLTLKPIG